MHYIGIDIGGTTTKAGRVDALGAIAESVKAPTPAENLENLIDTIGSLVSRLAAGAPVSAVGVGIPGLRNSRTGIIQTSPHIPCLRNVFMWSICRIAFFFTTPKSTSIPSAE